MNRSRLIIKIVDGEVVRQIKYDDEIGTGKENHQMHIPNRGIIGCTASIGLTSDHKDPVLIIDSDIIDVNELTDHAILSLWMSSMSWLMFWYAKENPAILYRHIIREQFFLIHELYGEKPSVMYMYKRSTKLDKAKRRPSYSKIRHRHVKYMHNIYNGSFWTAFSELQELSE